MPTKTSAGPNEVVRLEFLRLAPPLPLAASMAARAQSAERSAKMRELAALLAAGCVCGVWRCVRRGAAKPEAEVGSRKSCFESDPQRRSTQHAASRSSTRSTRSSQEPRTKKEEGGCCCCCCSCSRSQVAGAGAQAQQQRILGHWPTTSSQKRCCFQVQCNTNHATARSSHQIAFACALCLLPANAAFDCYRFPDLYLSRMRSCVRRVSCRCCCFCS
jgi:hypothetical protein